jgi:hypothetical protein
MPNSKYIPEPWKSFLEELDKAVTENVDFHCIGGFVITHLYGFERETRDVDVLTITPNTNIVQFLELGGEGSTLHKKYRVYLDKVGVIEAWPEDYDQRLTEMYPGALRHIRLLAPDPCDLALMKLGRNIERDREDVKFLARRGLITVEDLQKRYQREMRPYIALPERRMDLILELWVEMIREGIQEKL